MNNGKFLGDKIQFPKHLQKIRISFIVFASILHVADGLLYWSRPEIWIYHKLRTFSNNPVVDVDNSSHSTNCILFFVAVMLICRMIYVP